MDVEALKGKLSADTVEVGLLGQIFTLRSLTVAEAGPVQRELGRRLREAKKDLGARSQAVIDSTMDAVEACLVEDVPRDVLERVVVQTGTVLSPLMVHAKRLSGIEWAGDEEDPDRDLPT